MVRIRERQHRDACWIFRLTYQPANPASDVSDRTLTGKGSMATLLHESITRVIIGASMDVLNGLKPGLDEKLYENALVYELRQHGLTVAQQPQFNVEYKGQRVGLLIPDVIVNDSVIVDTKVVQGFDDNHIAQMVGYLSHTGLQLGMLINFKHRKLAWQRIIK
jgi:GxxExxY protein